MAQFGRRLGARRPHDWRDAADTKHERMLREAGETALTLIEDRGRANAHAWASHCATRDPEGFWRQVMLAIEEAP